MSMTNAVGQVTETQANELIPELTVELTNYDEALWGTDPEAGGVAHVEAAKPGKMVRIEVIGHAVLYVDAAGKLLVDNRN